MKGVNLGRVILGGLVAGIIVNISEWLMNGVVLKKDYEDAMKSMNKPAEMTGAQGAVWIVYGFVIAIAAVWLYAAIRSRYGAGAGTAARAGVAVWFFSYLLPNVAMANVGVFPSRVLVTTCVWGLVEQIVATTVGAWIYKENGA